MKINLDSPVEDVQIQIIPLIDVVFCILTFFILAALQFTRQQAISVDLPKASTGKIPQMRQTLIVTVDAVGQTYIEQQPVRPEQLRQELQNYHQKYPTGMMVLNASRTASYNDVVQVLDILRAVGGDRAALATTSAPEGQTGDRGTTPPTPNLVAPSTAPTAPDTYDVPNVNSYGNSVNPYGNSANPYGNPNPSNPYAPGPYSVPPGLPNGQGISPANPGTVPGVPVNPAPQATAAPGGADTAPPKR
jgi:biopolymer transport protein ExbD